MTTRKAIKGYPLAFITPPQVPHGGAKRIDDLLESCRDSNWWYTDVFRYICTANEKKAALHTTTNSWLHQLTNHVSEACEERPKASITHRPSVPVIMMGFGEKSRARHFEYFLRKANKWQQVGATPESIGSSEDTNREPLDEMTVLFGAVAKVTTEMAAVRAEALRLLAMVENAINYDARLQPLAVQLKQALGVVVDTANQQTDVDRDASEPVAAKHMSDARTRGIQYMTNEYKKPENLTLEDASLASGISDRVLNEKRQKGEVYALLPYGKTRGFRYPSWQFNADAQRLAAALAPFCKANASAWVIHNFMMRPHRAINGLRACDYICDASKPIETLIHAAQESLPHEQGAS